MTSSDVIDAAILASSSKQWLKTAMIIARAESLLRENGSDVGYEIIGKRVAHMASQGRFEAVGNMRNWRHSELRLAN